ncbi:MAG: hypothetical protein GWN54_10275, partial [Gammaproteobacteria bacterium]|nr:hypothetical protein [Gammaproteobacteria bacterium]
MHRARRFPSWLTRQAYWLAALLPLLIPLGWAVRGVPGFGLLYAWLSLLVLYVAIPLLDAAIGRDEHNPEPDEMPAGADNTVPLVAALSYFSVLAWALHTYAVHSHQFNAWDTLGWALSLADLGGVVAINVAHELIHRRDRRMRALGGALLSCVWYPGFKLEHPRWHHLHVATPADPSSAPLNSTIYRQVPRALVLNTIRGWKLGAEAAAARGRPALMNEMWA